MITHLGINRMWNGLIHIVAIPEVPVSSSTHTHTHTHTQQKGIHLYIFDQMFLCAHTNKMGFPSGNNLVNENVAVFNKYFGKSVISNPTIIQTTEGNKLTYCHPHATRASILKAAHWRNYFINNIIQQLVLVHVFDYSSSVTRVLIFSTKALGLFIVDFSSLCLS